MFFWNKICGLIAIFLFQNSALVAQNIPEHHSIHNNIKINQFNFSDSIHATFHLLNREANNIATIPANFSTCNFGFFCKEELKIEKATKVPIRLRLGSLQQCNYYEGKP